MIQIKIQPHVHCCCGFRLVREKVEKNEFGDIKEIIVILQKDFTLSVNSNNRKGGLMGLAATAIALGKVCCQYSYCEAFYFSTDDLDLYWYALTGAYSSHSGLFPRSGPSCALCSMREPLQYHQDLTIVYTDVF